MEKLAAWKFTLIGVLVVLGLLFLYLSGVTLGLDLKGGFQLVYQIETKTGVIGANTLEETIAVLQTRVDTFGMREIRFTPVGTRQFIVDLPGGSEAEKNEMKKIIESMGELHFKLLVEGELPGGAGARIWDRYAKEQFEKVRKHMDEIDRENAKIRAGNIELVKQGKNPKPLKEYEKEIVPFRHRVKIGEQAGRPVYKTEYHDVIVQSEPSISGEYLIYVGSTRDDLGLPAVGFEFDARRSREFGELTEKNEGRLLGIELEGEIRSAPVIKTRIEGRGIIEGDFSQDEVTHLVNVLRSGRLPSVPNLQSEFLMGPELGKYAVSRGAAGVIIALILVLAFMVVYYRGGGFVADAALVINMILILGILSVSEATLTLPGLAGLLLTVGMSVDANILIFERIREEKQKGKSIRQAVETGYKRAFWTIFDANLTTLITAYILYRVGTGPVRGFAVTLSIGILCSMFTALFATRAVIGYLIDKRRITELRMLSLLHKPAVQFIKFVPVAITVSIILIVGSLALFFSRGEGKYGIDFTGGTLFHLSLHKPQKAEDIRAKISQIEEFRDTEVVTSFEGREDEDKNKDISYGFIVRARLGDLSEVFRSEVAKSLNIKKESIRQLTEEEKKRKELGFPYGFSLAFPSPVKRKDIFEQIRDIDIVEDVRVTAEGGKEEAAELIADCKLHEPQEVFGKKIEDALGELLAPVAFELSQEEQLERKKLKKEDKILVFATLRMKKEQVKIEQIKNLLKENGFTDCKLEVRSLPGSYKDYSRLKIETEKLSKEIKETALYDIQSALKRSELAKLSQPFPRKESIGASVAYNLKSKAIIAISLALIAIIIYIALRFEFWFGIAAVIALAHDVAIALGIITIVDMSGLLQLKIDLPIIAAFLTIVGYSLNDTIVVFDRVRENLRRGKFARGSVRRKQQFKDLVNTSINETLSRTILTSFTTSVVVLVLLFCGVAAIQGFTFTMLIGVIVGTYSSIFIASPALILLERYAEKRHEKQKRRETKIAGKR